MYETRIAQRKLHEKNTALAYRDCAADSLRDMEELKHLKFKARQVIFQ